jgi:hypothetical protein
VSRVGDVVATYRNKLVNAITGARPCECYVVHDAAALDKMLQQFVEMEQVITALRHKGYGNFGMSMLEVVNAVPERVKA